MPRRLSSIPGSEVVWLLELRFGGRDFRWATDHISLSNASGDSLDFSGSLDLGNYSESLDRFTHTADAQSVSLEVVFDDIDVASQVSKGYHLGGVEGEISIVQVLDGSPQQTYEQRSIVARGSVADPQFGQPDRPEGYMAFTLEGMLVEDSGQFLSPTHAVTEDTFGSFPAWSDSNPHIDKPYPIVFGRPGRYRKADSDGTVTSTDGSPAYILELQPPGGTEDKTGSLVIAGHHVVASSVRVKAERTGETHVIFNSYDNLGRPVAINDYSDIDGSGTNSSFSNAVLEEREWWIGWTRSGGYGIENPWHSGQGLARAGDLIRWALTYSTLPVDWGAWQAASDTLNAYEFSGYITERVTPWDWLQPLLELLPVTVRRGVDGIYPILHDTGSDASRAVKLTTSPDFQRTSPVQIEGNIQDIYNRIEVHHAYSGKNNAARTYSALGQFESYDFEPETGSNSIVRRSEDRHGSRLLSKECAYLYERATADRICHDLSRRHALFSSTVQYRAAQSYVWLELGDLVAITDSDLGYSDQVAQIIARAWDGDSWIFTIVIDQDPERDTLGS